MSRMDFLSEIRIKDITENEKVIVDKSCRLETHLGVLNDFFILIIMPLNFYLN